ncbi:MAG: S8/S53 family peptidase [Microbacterium sp.]|uniref:S8 family peptidase n=1 Tax=Microbacterium sp. TaxID=51671 RepID=UPI0039E3AC03
MAEPPAEESRSEPKRVPAWRARFDAARERGAPLDPQSEPVEDVSAYPTAYALDHLLVTAEGTALGELRDELEAAAGEFGWGVRLQNLDGTDLELDEAIARAARWRERLDLPTIHRIGIVREPREDRDDQPVPPIDAWRLLQRARARKGVGRSKELKGVSLDHVMSIDPFGGKRTNPFGGKRTNPFGGKRTNGTDSYAYAGSGGRQVVDYVGAEPTPQRQPIEGRGRRPVVAVLDTGCGKHDWLDKVVTTYPTFEERVIGLSKKETDPEATGDVAGPYDGEIDDAAGHGTFIAGIVRQKCPDAEIVSVRVADSQGTVLEGEFMYAARVLVQWMATPIAEGGRPIDVINLSLGYYHETPEDELFDLSLHEILVAARRHGCAVVCSAGNDATDRPAFPAALWAWPDADFTVTDPADAAPHLSVGALNPNGTMALFSNLGDWVATFAPGASVVSSLPPFEGGGEPDTRSDRDGVRRETIDPDDFTGGFAIWSGTSFAAPYVAGLLAEAIADGLVDGTISTDAERVAALRAAKQSIIKELKKRGPAPV